MTDLRQAAMLALDFVQRVTSWEGGSSPISKLPDKHDTLIALRTALEQPEQEPVVHSVIAGAIFDFMGWLTSRKERLALSSTDNASPAADAIKDFAKMRGLSLDDARVQDWKDYTTPPAAQWDKPSASFDEWWDSNRHDPANPFVEGTAAYWAWAGWKAAQREWQGLTDEEVKHEWEVWRASLPRYIGFAQGIEAKLKERNT